MLRKTRGIILRVTHYAETSLIIKIYTEDFGMESYLINGVRKAKSRFKSNLFQHLSLVELVAYHKNGHGLKRISEITSHPQFSTIPYDVMKSSIAIFLNELIYRSIREEERNPPMFHFLHRAISVLDAGNVDCSLYHLFFMIRFTGYLGFFPSANYDESTGIFNMQEGVFQKNVPSHPYYLDHEQTKYFYILMKSDFENYHAVKMHSLQKKELLHALITYFELHHTSGSRLRSHHVLHEVMN